MKLNTLQPQKQHWTRKWQTIKKVFLERIVMKESREWNNTYEYRHNTRLQKSTVVLYSVCIHIVHVLLFHSLDYSGVSLFILYCLCYINPSVSCIHCQILKCFSHSLISDFGFPFCFVALIGLPFVIDSLPVTMFWIFSAISVRWRLYLVSGLLFHYWIICIALICNCINSALYTLIKQNKNSVHLIWCSLLVPGPASLIQGFLAYAFYCLSLWLSPRCKPFIWHGGPCCFISVLKISS